MADQVTSLREMVSRFNGTKKTGFRVIAVTSGKGGVGKTNFTVNLAIALVSQAYRVIVLDGDLGLANITVTCGLSPRFTMEHLFSGEKTIEEILIQGPGGIGILPGASGIQELAELDRQKLQYVVTNLGRLEKMADILIIDTGAGLGNTVINFLRASDDIILLTTKEPTALTDAYGLLKTLSLSCRKPVNVVVNRVKNESEAQATYKRLEIAVRKFLNLTPTLLGWVYEDPAVGKAVMKQEPFGLLYPKSAAYKCVKWVAGSLAGHYQSAPRLKRGIRDFLSALLQA